MDLTPSLVTAPGAAEALPEATPAAGEVDLVAAAAQLEAAGIGSGRAEVEVLARHVLAGDAPDQLPTTVDFGVGRHAFDELLARRLAREPLAHLTGSVVFRGITIAVGTGVFVPQPETSSLVEWVVANVGEAGIVVDLCTGAGTLALALAQELAGARVHAVEKSPEALVWTRRNAALRQAAGDAPVTVHAGDIDGCLPELDGTVDLLVSNPPYVATHESHIPSPEVLDHDPGIALWAGADGLDVVRLVEAAAGRLLRSAGHLVIEHSDRQRDAVLTLLHGAARWYDIADHRDHEGRDRFSTARRA